MTNEYSLPFGRRYRLVTIILNIQYLLSLINSSLSSPRAVRISSKSPEMLPPLNAVLNTASCTGLPTCFFNFLLQSIIQVSPRTISNKFTLEVTLSTLSYRHSAKFAWRLTFLRDTLYFLHFSFLIRRKTSSLHRNLTFTIYTWVHHSSAHTGCETGR